MAITVEGNTGMTTAMNAEKFLNCPKCGEGGKRWLHDAQHCEFCGYSGIKAAFKPMGPPVTVASDTDELPIMKQMCVLMTLQREAAGYHDIKAKWDAAINETHTCDDINLDQPLAGIIADLQKDRERLWDENKRLKAALLADEQKAKAMGENW